MKHINIILYLFIVLILNSCTEKVIILPQPVIPSSDKILLIEELTGVECKNCPDGANVIKAIEETYPHKVITIAIHAGSLTHPLASSKYDLKSEDGSKLEKTWLYPSKPAAAFNRQQYADQDGIPVAGYSNWQTYAGDELEKDNVIFCSVFVNFNSNTRELNAEVTLIPEKDLAGSFNINLFVTESKIIDSQLQPNGSVMEDYVFENVLRDIITPFDGELIGSDLKENITIKKTFSYTLPVSDDLWVAENIKVVAFVTGGIDSPASPVLNAAETHIIE